MDSIFILKSTDLCKSSYAMSCFLKDSRPSLESFIPLLCKRHLYSLAVCGLASELLYMEVDRICLCFSDHCLRILAHVMLLLTMRNLCGCG